MREAPAEMVGGHCGLNTALLIVKMQSGADAPGGSHNLGRGDRLGIPRRESRVQKSISPRLILMASSTRSMFCLESRPIFFWSRSRSTDRIWLTITAERFGKPLSAGSITTSLGNGGSENWELMAATIVIGLYWLETSFWMTTAGRVFWISWPTVGSNETR